MVAPSALEQNALHSRLKYLRVLTMASNTEQTLINLDNVDDNVKKAVVVLLRAAEVAQQKGAFSLDDAGLVHEAKRTFVAPVAKDDTAKAGK